MAINQQEANENFFARSLADWESMGGHPSVKSLTDVRRGRVAQMLAPAEAPEFDEDPDEFLELGKLDGRTLLAEYEEEMSCYATTPFDQHGERLRLYPCGV